MVWRAAARAFALDVTVGQKHALDRVKKLLDGLGGDQAIGAQREVNLTGEFMVFRRVGGMPMVKRDIKAIEIRFAPGGDLGDKGLGCFARLFGGDHDGRAVGVVGANKMHVVPQHAQAAHPDVGLDVLHHVPHMKRRVGVGQGSGNEERAWHGRGRLGQSGSVNGLDQRASDSRRGVLRRRWG